MTENAVIPPEQTFGRRVVNVYTKPVWKNEFDITQRIIPARLLLYRVRKIS